ncbi:LytR/AlgR family response regulator transcription factor [Aquimarina megaterium]|uniref:LytR/AlgR family response regulator transcription factor n=1 Tax=Aquimarina megaterium TaxID=1443666 RepID=UPI00046F5623|nr:LytTR family DNA-binding domain-containing protein [Aquimarina megaterium]
MNAIIVDDEINARENLGYLLDSFCSEINVVAEATHVDEAVKLINKHKPELVFLDIEMPQKNGFQLLNAFEDVHFHIIFVTAYDHYAIRAFQIAAIDYLLKPIDVSLLKKAIKKVIRVHNNSFGYDRIETLLENRKGLKKIAIPYKSDYAILDIDTILCIEADRMYTILYTVDHKKYMVAKKLSYYEELLCKDTDFIRLHRSWIVNSNKIETYSKKNKEVVLQTQLVIPVSKGYKDNFEAIFYT